MKEIELHEFNYLPPGIEACTAKNLHHHLPGPSLIHLAGKKTEPLFISILQHGNEAVGLYALQNLLNAYQNEPLPRSISIFVGNVQAAQFDMRRLDHQPDYNRMWPSKMLDHDLPEARLMRQVWETMRQRKPFASIDLHNNTGLNPHYACINKLDNRFYHLATMFSRQVVYFIQPQGVQSMAFAELCPSVTLECGHVEDKAGIDHAFEYLDACLQLSEIPSSSMESTDMDLYHTVATVKVPQELTFSYEDSTQDIYFSPELEKYNFLETEKGSLVALTHPDKTVRLKVYNEAGEDVASEYFDFNDNEIRLMKTVMPSMITSNEKVIRQDCLCYLMERYPF